LIQKLKSKIFGSALVRNTLILSLATLLAQLIAVIFSPVLSRLFTPSNFGELGKLVAFSSIFVGIASLKYEQAIVLSKSAFETKQLIKISHVLIVIISLISIPIYMLTYQVFDFYIQLSILLIIYFNSIYNLIINIYTRYKNFKSIAVLKVINKVTTVGTQIGLGIFGLGTFGLIIGQILGLFLTLVYSSIKSLNAFINIILVGKESYKEAKPTIIKHYRFPMFTAPQNLLNSLSQNAPILLLDGFFGSTIIGLYWFAYRIIQMPIVFISNSIRQTFYQKASVTKPGKELTSLFVKSTRTLLLIGLPFTIIGMLILPDLFEFIFGSEWIESGIYGKWLLPWVLLLFINPPAVMLIPILKIQKFNLLYDICLLAARIFVICMGGYFFTPLITIILFSLVSSVFNLFIIGFVYYKLNLLNAKH
tara:strand:+ start:1860 stop:3122 length:1263 start_codon:yes stop_codon:yes gene_type:complete